VAANAIKKPFQKDSDANGNAKIKAGKLVPAEDFLDMFFMFVLNSETQFSAETGKVW
jgi:hypothetical protein